MAFTKDTNSIPLFNKTNGDYHAQAKISYTNNGDRTFTVKVEGVRAYCNKGWNFKSNVSMWLGTSSSGADKVSQTGTIGNSGSNTYTGWLPTSGYANITLSKKFNYNDDGSVPTVYFYLNVNNPNVYYINAGYNVPVNVTFSGNLKDHISKIAPKDVNPPKITASENGCDSSTLKWKCSSDHKCSSWEYRLDGGSWKTFGTAGKSTSGSVSANSGQHTLEVAGKKESNGKWGYASKLSYDTTLPTIKNLKITVTDKTKGTLEFTCNYKCDYKLEGGGTNTGWISNLSANTNPKKTVTLKSNDNVTYTLYVRRADNNKLTKSDSCKADTRLPNITYHKFVPTDTNSGTLIVRSDFKCHFRYKINGSWSDWSGVVNANTDYSKTINLPENKKSTVIVEVYRDGYNKLTNSKDVQCDLLLPTPTLSTPRITNGQVSVTLNCDTDYEFCYSVNGSGWTKWSEEKSANKNNVVNIKVPSDRKNNIKFKVRRTYAHCLTGICQDTYDGELPDIYSQEILVTSATTAVVKFKCTHSCDYRITGDTLDTGWINKLKADTNPDKQIKIKKDTLSSYKIEVKRRGDYSSLTNSVTVKDVDTRIPKIISKKFTAISSTQGKIEVKSDFDCKFDILENGEWSALSSKIKANSPYTKTLTLPKDSDGKISIRAHRTQTPNLVGSDEIKYDLRLPNYDIVTKKITRDRVTVYLKNTGKVTNCQYRYRINSENFVNKWYDIGKSEQLDIEVPQDVENTIHYQFRRSDSKDITSEEYPKTYNNTPPQIDIIGKTIVDSSNFVLTFKCDRKSYINISYVENNKSVTELVKIEPENVIPGQLIEQKLPLKTDNDTSTYRITARTWHPKNIIDTSTQQEPSLNSKKPVIKAITFTVNDKQSGNIHLIVDTSFKYSYKIEGESTWSEISSEKPGKKEITIQNISLGEDTKKKVIVRTYNTTSEYIYDEKEIECDLLLPKAEVRVVDISNTSAKLKVICDRPFKYKTKVKNSWSSLSNRVESVAQRTVDVDANSNSDVTVQVQRNDQSKLFVDIPVPITTIKPNLSNMKTQIIAKDRCNLVYKNIDDFAVYVKEVVTYDSKNNNKSTRTIDKVIYPNNELNSDNLQITEDCLNYVELYTTRYDSERGVNTSITQSNRVSVDVTLPEPVEVSLTVNSGNHGTLYIKPNISCNIVWDNKEKSILKDVVNTINVNLNNNRSINYTLINRNVKVLQESYKLSYDNRLPNQPDGEIVSKDTKGNDKLTVINSNTMEVCVDFTLAGETYSKTSPTATLEIELDGIIYGKYKDVIIGKNNCYNVPIKNDYKGWYTFRLRRNDNPKLCIVELVEIDSRLPKVSEVSCYISRSMSYSYHDKNSKGYMKFNAKYDLANVNIKYGMYQNVVTSGNKKEQRWISLNGKSPYIFKNCPQIDVTETGKKDNDRDILVNTGSSQYVIRFYRADNEYLYIDIPVKIPLDRAPVKLGNIDDDKQYASNGSDNTFLLQQDYVSLYTTPCTDVYLYYLDENTLVINNERIDEIPTLKNPIAHTVTDLIPGHKYLFWLRSYKEHKHPITGKRTALVSYESESVSVDILGGSYVYVNGNPKSATAYVYHNGEWCVATPYVCDENKKWHRGI